MGTITRRPVGLEDLFLFDGVNKTKTVTNNAGEVILLHGIGKLVDVFSTYGYKSIRTSSIIKNAINAVPAEHLGFDFTAGNWTITENVSFPNNITPRILPGAIFQIANGVTVTFSISPIVGKYKWIELTGTGKVKFPKDTIIYPEWYGAKSDGSTESAAAINSAIAAAAENESCVELSSGTYLCAGDSIKIPLAVNLIGQGMDRTIIDSRYNGPAIVGTDKIKRQTIKGFTVTQANNTNSSLNIFDLLYGASYCQFEDIRLIGSSSVTSNGFVLRGLHPTEGPNTNQYSNHLKNIHTSTADSQISGVGIYLYGTDQTNTRCNNNVLDHCVPNSFSTGIYIYGQNNHIEKPSFQTAYTGGSCVHVVNSTYGGTLYNVLNGPYYDSTVVGNKVLLTCNVNGGAYMLVIYDVFQDNNPMTVDDIVTEGTNSDKAYYSLYNHGIWFHHGPAASGVMDFTKANIIGCAVNSGIMQLAGGPDELSGKLIAAGKDFAGTYNYVTKGGVSLCMVDNTNSRVRIVSTVDAVNYHVMAEFVPKFQLPTNITKGFIVGAPSDNVWICFGTVDPTVNGIDVARGSLYCRTGTATNKVYIKSGNNPTDWTATH